MKWCYPCVWNKGLRGTINAFLMMKEVDVGNCDRMVWDGRNWVDGGRVGRW